MSDEMVKERRARAFRALLMIDHGIMRGSFDLHEYLLAHEGRHSTVALAKHFGVGAVSIYRWLRPLVQLQLAEVESVYSDVWHGGRLPSEVWANRRRKSLEKWIEEQVEAEVRDWSLGKELATR